LCFHSYIMNQRDHSPPQVKLKGVEPPHIVELSKTAACVLVFPYVYTSVCHVLVSPPPYLLVFPYVCHFLVSPLPYLLVFPYVCCIFKVSSVCQYVCPTPLSKFWLSLHLRKRCESEGGRSPLIKLSVAKQLVSEASQSSAIARINYPLLS
jgi:hypothetical protein